MFQMRASSRVPWKAPRRVPVDVTIAPSAACWRLSNRGENAPTKSVASRFPFR